ncbi:MAG: hypothetical protein RSE16_00770 [Sphingobium sp.]|nr:MAG: hypothetical protein RSE16_00770 [Sphingobium sp.]
MQLRFSILITALALAACSVPTPPAPAPQPVPPPSAPLAAPPLVAPVQQAADWIDWPIEAGTWVYRTDTRGSVALFGPAGGDAVLTLRCDKGRGRVYLSVAGTAEGSLTVRTSSTLKTFAAIPSSVPPPYVAAEIMPADQLLDAMAFSRGRFAIEIGGTRAMAVPNWGEVARIVEDCRT